GVPGAADGLRLHPGRAGGAGRPAAVRCDAGGPGLRGSRVAVIGAILLVGGQGTRLRPLTVTTPKPLLPAAGVPFLLHPLSRLGAAGIRDAVLATSYRAELFEATFGPAAGGGRREAGGPRLSYAGEQAPWGTGGGIRHALDRLSADTVLVLNGDQLSGLDLAAVLAAHADRDADVTLHVAPVEDARPYGSVVLDGDGRVLALHEKSARPVSNLVNAGCYVFRRAVLEKIPAGRPVSVEREVFPELIAAGARVFGYVSAAYSLDIGTPAAFVQASVDLVTGVAPT